MSNTNTISHPISILPLPPPSFFLEATKDEKKTNRIRHDSHAFPFPIIHTLTVSFLCIKQPVKHNRICTSKAHQKDTIKQFPIPPNQNLKHQISSKTNLQYHRRSPHKNQPRILLPSLSLSSLSTTLRLDLHLLRMRQLRRQRLTLGMGACRWEGVCGVEG